MFSLLGTFSGHLSRQTSRDILKETNENGKMSDSTFIYRDFLISKSPHAASN